MNHDKVQVTTIHKLNTSYIYQQIKYINYSIKYFNINMNKKSKATNPKNSIDKYKTTIDIYQSILSPEDENDSQETKLSSKASEILGNSQDIELLRISLNFEDSFEDIPSLPQQIIDLLNKHKTRMKVFYQEHNILVHRLQIDEIQQQAEYNQLTNVKKQFEKEVNDVVR